MIERQLLETHILKMGTTSFVVIHNCSQLDVILIDRHICAGSTLLVIVCATNSWETLVITWRGIFQCLLVGPRTPPHVHLRGYDCVSSAQAVNCSPAAPQNKALGLPLGSVCYNPKGELI